MARPPERDLQLDCDLGDVYQSILYSSLHDIVQNEAHDLETDIYYVVDSPADVDTNGSPGLNDGVEADSARLPETIQIINEEDIDIMFGVNDHKRKDSVVTSNEGQDIEYDIDGNDGTCDDIVHMEIEYSAPLNENAEHNDVIVTRQEKLNASDKYIDVIHIEHPYSVPWNIVYGNETSEIGYICKKCHNVFGTEKLLRIHSKIHRKTWRCRSCGVGFKRKPDLLQHQGELHKYEKLEKRFACLKCGKSFSSPTNLLFHKSYHHAKPKCREVILKCTECGKHNSSLKLFRKHMARHGKELPHTCHICFKGFLSEASLNRHENIHKDKVLKCPRCGRGFINNGTLKNHIKHHPEQWMTCEICKKVFTNATRYRNHQYLHSADGQIRCNICDKTYKNVRILMEHERTHSTVKSFTCRTCGRGFVTEKYLVSHELLHGDITKPVCEKCGKSYSTRHNLSVHTKTNCGERLHPCKICNKSFSYLRSLKKHMVVHVNPHACEICGKIYTHPHALKEHMLAQHEIGIAESHQCKFCEKRYVLQVSLSRHMKLHNEVKKHECSMCEKSYSRPSQLLEHMCFHTGQYPLNCRFCNKGFTRTRDLNRHEQTHIKREHN